MDSLKCQLNTISFDEFIHKINHATAVTDERSHPQKVIITYCHIFGIPDDVNNLNKIKQ